MPKKDFNKTDVKNKIFIKFFYYENKLIYPVHTSDQKVKNSMDLFIIIEFKNYSKQIPTPFKTYADFVCILKSVKSNEETSGSCTEKYQNPIPCSFAFKHACVDNKFSNSVALYRC